MGLRRKTTVLAAVGFVASSAALSRCSASTAVPANFNGYGTTVSGFQDFFTESSATFESNYTEIANAATVATGSTGDFTLDSSSQMLDINGIAGNPNKLLYSGASYSTSNQSILAEIAVTDGGSGDGWRGGISTVSDPGDGRGINQVFRTSGDEGRATDHTDFLNDNIAWGPEIGSNLSFGSTPLTYYWLKLTTTTDSGGNEITGEIWPADGTTPESAAQTATWNQSGGSERSGLAGLLSDSGGSGTFAVNYLLVQSQGLSSIDAGIVPEPTSLALLSIGSVAVLSCRRRRI